MLIKSADDKSKRLALLEDLQNSPVVDAWLCRSVGMRFRGLQYCPDFPEVSA